MSADLARRSPERRGMSVDIERSVGEREVRSADLRKELRGAESEVS